MNTLELLSPVGDFDCLKAAIQNGANAVYLGASNFNARASASNFNLEELENAILYAKLRNVKVYLTLNTLINNDEISEAVELATTAYNLGIDGIIIQDLGLASLLHEFLPDLPLHASTQMTIYNLEGVKELEKLGFKRVVLARELSIPEIEYICKNTNLEIEVFIHGALCVSYSGQCLMSSSIGGRSGNRGKCAQPCRLPYTLLKNNSSQTKACHLLSTKDVCTIDFLPELIKAGITSFKIEGRLKSPEYVAEVTKTYRKYIDLALSSDNYEVDKQDKLDLMQIFNRGNFSSRLFEAVIYGKNMVYMDKPNHMGIVLGKVLHFNNNKGHIKIKLENPIDIGDQVQINNNSYTVSEIMDKNKNLKTTSIGQIITLGRMKGNISEGNIVYKISSKSLNKLLTESFARENVKLPLYCEAVIKENTNISLIISYGDIKIDYNSNIIPQKAINTPITKERIQEQIRKTGNTPFEFKEINITLDDGLSIPISSINELRRSALEKFETEFKNKFRRNASVKNIENCVKKQKVENKQISILLNILNTSNKYENLKNIDNIYIPFKYFINPLYKECIEEIIKIPNSKKYIYFPTITKKNYTALINKHLNNIVNTYNISGFVISNIGQLQFIKEYDLEIIANYTLNIFNNYTNNFLKNNNFKRITISPELNKELINTFDYKNVEFIVYGRLPLMTSSFCVIGANCSSTIPCSHPCKKEENFLLKDRLRF